MLDALPDKLGERELTRQADLAPARAPRGGARRRRRDARGSSPSSRRRFDPGSREVARRAPAHLPPREGARVRRRVPAAARGRRSCRRGSRRPTRIATRSVGSSTSGSRAPDGFSQSPGRAIRARSSQSSASRDGRRGRSAAAVEVGDPVLYDALSAWRKQRAQSDAVPAYVVFHNATLAAIAGAKPRSIGELASVPGLGPTKIERYGDEVLAVVGQAG